MAAELALLVCLATSSPRRRFCSVLPATKWSAPIAFAIAIGLLGYVPICSFPNRFAQSEDKTFIAPPGMWHILLKEKGNEQVGCGEGAHMDP